MSTTYYKGALAPGYSVFPEVDDDRPAGGDGVALAEVRLAGERQVEDLAQLGGRGRERGVGLE